MSNATTVVATLRSDAAAEPLEVSAALIGGIVGGVVALLFVVGLIAFLVSRSRRHTKAESKSDAALQSVRQRDSVGDAGAASHGSNYESLALRPPQNNYGVVSQPQRYDSWSTKQNYAKPNRSDYEQGDVTPFN
jgi:hypothetical protein